MRRSRAVLWASLGVLSWLLMGAGAASAHPVGNERYSLLHAIQLDEGDQLALVTILEIPMMVALREVAEKLKGQADREAAVEAYTDAQCAQLAAGLVVEVNGHAVPGTWTRMEDPRNGKLIEAFFTYLVVFEPDRPLKIRPKPLDVVIRDTSYAGKDMVFAGRVEATPPWIVASRTVPHGEWSDETSWRTLEARFERL